MDINSDEYFEVCVAEARYIFVGAIIYTHSELYQITSIRSNGNLRTFEVVPVIPDGANPLLSMEIYKGALFSVYSPKK